MKKTIRIDKIVVYQKTKKSVNLKRKYYHELFIFEIVIVKWKKKE